MEIKNYRDLKDFCNSLTESELQQEVYLAQVEDSAIKVESAWVSQKDEYYDHCDYIGDLESIKSENPDDWESEIADYNCIPKGTVALCNE